MFHSLVCGGLSASPLCCFSPPLLPSFAPLTSCLWFFKWNKYIKSRLSQAPLPPPSENLPSSALTAPLPQSLLASFRLALLFVLSIVLFPQIFSRYLPFKSIFLVKETKQSGAEAVMAHWSANAAMMESELFTWWFQVKPSWTCSSGEQRLS